MRLNILFSSTAPRPAALLSQEQHARDHAVPKLSGPSESEVTLQEALDSLQQEKEALTEQYQAQVGALFSHPPLQTFSKSVQRGCCRLYYHKEKCLLAVGQKLD